MIKKQALVIILKQALLPTWLKAPDWLLRADAFTTQLITHHEAIGLGITIAAEEAGVPLPIPGDVLIAFAGYMVYNKQLKFDQVLIAVVAGAFAGASFLYFVSKRLGRSFILAFAKFAKLEPSKLARVERVFQRWGILAVAVGRLIPGLRIAMTIFAGTMDMPYFLFASSIFVSSIVWALIYVNLGRILGPSTVALLDIVPAQVPFLIAVLVISFLLFYIFSRRRKKAGNNKEPKTLG